MDTIIDRLIVGNINGNSTGYTSATQDLIKRIASGQDIVVTEATFLNTDPIFLAVLLFNYPLINENCYKEFAAAVKKISMAKYTYYKKSSSFKDQFNKLLNDMFTKFHQSFEIVRDQKDQIQKVKYAIPLTKFMGELYNTDFIINCNIKFFLENLVKAADTSKVSEDCLQELISIISDRAKNEFKQFHKHNHDVHTAAIMKILAEYEEGFDEVNAKKKKNYKDLEIIEAVKKTSINKNGKIAKIYKKQPSLSSKGEVIIQSKKLLETILAGSNTLNNCIHTAQNLSRFYSESFENEMFQLCLEYIKKHLVNVDEANLTTTCVTLGKFIGKLYCADVFRNESIKGTLSLLSKFEGIEQVKPIQQIIFKTIYGKVMEINDDVLKSSIPEDFKIISQDGEIDSDESMIDAAHEKGGNEPAKKIIREEKKATISYNNNQPSVSVAIPMYISPIDRFKELLCKLSLTNIAYVLREVEKIPFVSGEETVSDLASHLVSHALKKQSLIKAVVQVCLKLPDTIVPHFNMSLLKKNLKSEISNSVIGCSEDKATGCSLMVKELHAVGIYDRFDIILLLENFTINFDNDRTALSSLIKFSDELKDLINNNKKLSKNMSMKLKRIGERLSEQMKNEAYKDYLPGMEMAVKILNGEYKAQLASNNAAINGTRSNNNYIVHQDSKNDNDEQEENDIEESREPDQMILGTILLKFPLRKMSAGHNSTSEQYPPTPPPPPSISQRSYMPSQMSIENAVINNDNLFGTTSPDRSTPSTCDTLSTTNDDTLFSMQPSAEELYSTVVNCGHPNASIGSNEAHDEDEQFYDTYTHADGTEESSNFKFLEECTRDRTQELQDLIFDQVSSNELSEFVATVVLLGTKFQSIDTFLKFLSVVENALDRQGKDAHVNFKRYLELKIPTFYDLLICSQDEPKSDREKIEIEHLVIVTGEFYNRSLISDGFYLRVLDKLWKVIINAHHVKIFNLLIVTCAAKITNNGIASTCKNYLDNLAKYIHSFDEVKDQQFLSNDIVKTLKLLMMHHQDHKRKTLGNPTTFFKTSLTNLSEENFKQTLLQMKTVFPVAQTEMMEIVDIFIKFATINENQGLFIKFAEKIRNAGTSDALNFSFKMHLEDRLKVQIPKILEDLDQMEPTSLKWTSMVSELYLVNVVSIELFYAIFQALFEREVNNKLIVDIINLLLRKVGLKMDLENEKILDNFFMYFSVVINSGENSYRTKIYKDLLRLRNMKWSNEKRAVDVMEEYMKQLDMKNIVEVTKNIGTKINESGENLAEFINLLWKFVIDNPNEVLKHVKLTEGLSYIHETFNRSLMQFMKQRNLTFCSIGIQQFNPALSKKLATAIHFMCYLYLSDVAGEEHLEMWIRPNFVQHLSLEQNADFSVKLVSKIEESSNVNLKAFLTFVELSVNQQLINRCKAIETNLEDMLAAE